MSMEEEWVAVCPTTDILPWTGVAARIDGQQVAIFRTADNEIFVIGNHDPFSGANVISRGIVGDIDGELVVASPVYKQHFRLRDGICIEDAQVSLGSWPVRIFDGIVVVGRHQQVRAA
ncbi:MAG: nitrite reductase small subunit NirD [Alcanivoracaceae bacterium]|nr:nitrite reductase small subunit NirD [Alcanivoracaceae bacterium]